MIRILHLVSTFQVKTDTKWLVRLLGKVDRSAFDVAAGAFYDDGPIRGQFGAMGIETFNLNTPQTWDFRVVGHLMKRIREFDPDIIHTHLLRADLFGGLAGKLAGRRVVSTVYAYGDYRRAYRRGWKDWWLDRASTLFADKFISVCQAIKDDLVSRVGISPERIQVIHTGMDPVEPNESAVSKRRAELGITPGEKVVLVGARLSYEKGVDCFLRAVKVLVDRGVTARFIVAGGGPMDRELHDLARTLGVEDRVQWLGFVTDLEVLMKLSSVVVIPSYCEGLPNVALEAFAMGRPVVASRVGGLIDLETMDPQAILLSTSNSPEDLADKIGTVLSDSSLASAVAEHGRHIIEQRLSTEHVARRYEELYRRITDSGRDSGAGGTI